MITVGLAGTAVQVVPPVQSISDVGVPFLPLTVAPVTTSVVPVPVLSVSPFAVVPVVVPSDSVSPVSPGSSTQASVADPDTTWFTP